MGTARLNGWLLTVWLLGVTCRDACAYIDPGTSSILYQLAIAGITALIFTLSKVRRALVRGFLFVFRRNGKSPKQ